MGSRCGKETQGKDELGCSSNSPSSCFCSSIKCSCLVCLDCCCAIDDDDDDDDDDAR